MRSLGSKGNQLNPLTFFFEVKMKYLLSILILICLAIPCSAQDNNSFAFYPGPTNNIFETEVVVRTPAATVQIQKSLPEEVIVVSGCNACAGGTCVTCTTPAPTTSRVAVRTGPARTVVRATVRRANRWRPFRRVFSRRCFGGCCN